MDEQFRKNARIGVTVIATVIVATGPFSLLAREPFGLSGADVRDFWLSNLVPWIAIVFVFVFWVTKDKK